MYLAAFSSRLNVVFSHNVYICAKVVWTRMIREGLLLQAILCNCLKSNSVQMVLWDASPPSSQSADFLNKVTTVCLNTSPLDLLACQLVSSRSFH